MSSEKRGDDLLGMTCPISRRDFVNGALTGAGAALVAGCKPPFQPANAGAFSPSGSAWTGFGGLGDYAWANGNTEAVMNAAHALRDGAYDERSTVSIEEVDAVVVGGGFSGLTSAYELKRTLKPGQTILILENHAMPGGEAKENMFEVDGHHLVAPQGSNGSILPQGRDWKGTRVEIAAKYWDEFGLPKSYDLEQLAGGAERYNLPHDHFGPMLDEKPYSVGYFFGDKGWVKNPAAAKFKNTHWSADDQVQMDDFFNGRRNVLAGIKDVDRWLDSMTYAQLLRKAGYGEVVERWVTPAFACGQFGVAADAVSAAAVSLLGFPLTEPPAPAGLSGDDVKDISFPGGNAAILRAMLRRTIPGSLPGPENLDTIVAGNLDFAALDRPGQAVRLKLNSTVVRVEHDGDPSTAGSVLVTYVNGGKQHRVRAKTAIMAIGGWVCRRVVRDLSRAHADAYAKMNYGPELTVNVAVRNWRFFDKLGISAARWFEGLGWHVVVRRNMVLHPGQAALTPDSPIVLTFYIPFLYPGEAPEVQGSLARQKILSTPYVDFERQIREQMTAMFGAYGFDARRDIAGVILNRWGHCFSAPPPGFLYSQDGSDSPRDILRKPFGRIHFAHSELSGRMNMMNAMNEANRAVREARSMI